MDTPPDGYLEERLVYLLDVWGRGATLYETAQRVEVTVPSLEEALVVWDDVVEHLMGEFPGYSLGTPQLTEEELAPVLASHLWDRYGHLTTPLFLGHFSYVEGSGKKLIHSIPNLLGICEDLHRFISSEEKGSFYTTYGFLRGVLLTYEYCC